MTPSEPHEDPPLVEGLTHLPEGALRVAAPPPGLDEAILLRTSRVVRGYRWRRRGLLAALLAFVYAAGGATGAWLGDREPAGPAVRTAARVADETFPAAPSERPPDPRSIEERLAEATPGERDSLLREAGDRYLAGSRPDPVAAMRCYERLLDGSSAPPGADDSWLLIYLKLSRP